MLVKINFKASNVFRRDDWISKLISSLSFCYQVSVAEQFLEL